MQNLSSISSVSSLKYSPTSKWYTAPNLALNGVLPSLTHDFIGNRYFNSTNKETTSPFAASRPGNAMQYNQQGQLVYGPANMLTISEPTTAVVGNPGTAPVGWGVTLGNTNGVTRSIVARGSEGGIDYMDIKFLGTFTAIENITITPAPGVTTVTTVPTESWTGSIYWSIIQGTLQDTFTSFLGGVRIRYGTPGLLAQSGSRNTALYTWTRDTHTSVAPATSTVVGTDWVWSFNAGAVVDFTLRVGAMQLEKTGIDSPKPYNKTTGTAYYGPRLDYDPFTRVALGFPIEEQRTNLVPVSLSTIASAMTAQIQTLAATKADSPATYLGNWAASRFTPDGTAAAHGAFAHSITPGANAKVSIQAIISPVSGSTFYQLTGSGAWLVDLNGYVNFNCSGAGSITATGASAEAPFIRRLATNVYHIGVTVTASAAPGSGATCIVGYLNTGLETRLPGLLSTAVFDYIYAAHFQGQLGYTSVIPTFGVAVTRGADSPSINVGSWFNSTRGTFYAEFIRSYVNSGSGATQCFAAFLENGSNFMQLTSGFGTHASHRFDTQVGGINQAQLTTTGTATAFTTRKMIGSYEASNFKAAENGSPAATLATGTIPTGIVNFQVGFINNSNHINGWVSKIIYWPDNSASGTQLQQFTA